MKNLKKILDNIAGTNKHRIRVKIRDVWSDTFTVIRFVAEIESAYLTQVLTVKMNISDRTINDETDDSEFEYQFNKKSFQEEFSYDTYENFNLSLLGIEENDLVFEFNFV